MSVNLGFFCEKQSCMMKHEGRWNTQEAHSSGHTEESWNIEAKPNTDVFTPLGNRCALQSMPASQVYSSHDCWLDGVLRLLSSDQGSPSCWVNTARLLISLCWWQNAWQTQFTEDRLTSTIWRYSPSRWGHCRGRSGGTCTQDLERDEYLCSACFLFSAGPSAYTMVSPTCRVALLTLINPIQKLPHRLAQRFVSR